MLEPTGQQQIGSTVAIILPVAHALVVDRERFVPFGQHLAGQRLLRSRETFVVRRCRGSSG